MADKIVVVIDSGGRGAALVHKYSQSPHVKNIIAIPGNDLMQLNSSTPVRTFPELKTTDIGEIIQVCKKYKVNLVDVAQDNAVEVGLTDKLIEQGFNVIGPTKAAGQIEWDKAWARDFMKRHKLPIPFYETFNSHSKAIKFVNKNPKKRFFVKAAGLADGKGAIPVENAREAIGAIKQMSMFGKAGETFVIEEWLDGEEFSMFAISDGKTFQIVGSAQDYKRLYDGDVGPNTGGIGCSAPALIVDKNIYKQAELILKTALSGLTQEGRIYKGILYLGAIVVRGKVFVIEFNARWGDPEAEVLIPSIKNDLYELSMSTCNGTLNKMKIRTDKKARVVITGSLKANAAKTERELFGIRDILRLPKVIIYGTRVTQDGSKYFVSSGRLFHIVGEGEDIIQARQRAYEAMERISIEGDNLHYRTDIGWRDVERIRKGWKLDNPEG